MYITPDTASRNPTSAAQSANDTDTPQQPTATQPSASNNPPLSGAQAARAADAARDRVTCHQDALQHQDYERQLVKWESEAPADEVGGRQRAASEIRRVIESGEKTLNLKGCHLTSLPLLPQGLTELFANDNKLTSLPKLPDGLTWLHAYDNQLTSLPKLPDGLTMLNAQRNQLTSLPKLPDGLIWLGARGNQLTSLPKLPDGLTTLEASGNQLTSLPKLPDGLIWLGARGNQLTSLPPLPQGLRVLYLDHNPQLITPFDTQMDSNCAAEARQWQSDHPHLVDRSAEVPVMPAPALPILASVAQQNGPDVATPAGPVALPTTTSAVQHPGQNVLATPSLQQPSLTPEHIQRIEQFLAANATPDQPPFTPEDRANLTTLLSMQDAIEAVINPSAPAPNAMLPREDMDKLIQFMQIKFADDREKQQWAAEIGALKTVYPDTAKGGLLLYNLLSRALIGLYHNAPQNTSGYAGTSHGMASSGATMLGTLASLLNFVPMVGNQATLAVQAGISIVDQKRMARDLPKGLEAMASVGNAGTLSEQEATMRHITHALAYRLTLHHCGKTLSGDSAVTQAVKTAIGIDNRSINNFQTYAQKITDAIMKSDKTFDGANVGLAITRLLTAALTGTVTGRSQERAQKDALALGDEHQRIIDGLKVAAGPVNPAPAGSTAPVTGVMSLRLQSSGWVRPTVARLPDVVSAMDIVEPAADEVVTPKSQRLLDKIYRLDDEEKVRDAGDTLDTRVRMKQAEQQNAQLRTRADQQQSENRTLRTVLQTLIDKPADPALGTLRHDVDRLSDQLASLQTTLTAAHGSATSAHTDIRTLTSQVLALSTTLENLEGGVTAMQVALDDTSTKADLAELGQSVGKLGQEKQYLTRDLHDLKKTVSKLADESDPGASSGGGQTMMARSRPAQGQSVADQYAQLTKLQDHVSTLSLAISDLQAQLGVATPKPEPDPNEATNRSQLFGNLFKKASRR